MLFQMRFRTRFTLLLSLIAPAGSASANMRFNFENCYKSYTGYPQIPELPDSLLAQTSNQETQLSATPVATI